MLKRKNGVTLIALIITIIVLLILAGVAIRTVTGDNGVLQKATKAKKSTSKASSEERIKMEVVGSFDDNLHLEADNVISNINKNLPEATISGDEFPLVVTLERLFIFGNRRRKG